MKFNAIIGSGEEYTEMLPPQSQEYTEMMPGSAQQERSEMMPAPIPQEYCEIEPQKKVEPHTGAAEYAEVLPERRRMTKEATMSTSSQM